MTSRAEDGALLDVRASLQARAPQRVKDSLWAKYGEGSEWIYENGVFTFVPPRKQPNAGFSIETGDQPGQFYEMVHATGALALEGHKGLVRVDRYILIDINGDQVGGMLWRGNPEMGDQDAWFPSASISGFLRNIPRNRGLKRSTMPSLMHIKEHYPLLHAELSKPSRGFLGRLFR